MEKSLIIKFGRGAFYHRAAFAYDFDSDSPADLLKFFEVFDRLIPVTELGSWSEAKTYELDPDSNVEISIVNRSRVNGDDPSKMILFNLQSEIETLKEENAKLSGACTE